MAGLAGPVFSGSRNHTRDENNSFLVSVKQNAVISEFDIWVAFIESCYLVVLVSKFELRNFRSLHREISESSAMNSEFTSLADRIRFAAKRAGGGNDLSQKTGIPRSTLETYMTGQSEPQVSRLIEIAKASDVNVAWLATGDGPKTTDESDVIEHHKKTGVLEIPSATIPSFSAPAQQQVDPELFGRITDAIAATYKAENARISPRDLGRMAARMYGEITELSDDPTEREGMIKLKAAQLQRELRTPISSSDNSKASA